MPPPPPVGGTLFAIVERYRSLGVTVPFAVRPDGRVMCGACRNAAEARGVRVLALEQPPHEVAPGERLAVAALQCSACDVQGILPLTYGPCALPDEDTVFAQLAVAGALGGPVGA